MAEELVQTYVNWALLKGSKPNSDGFFVWFEEASKTNLNLVLCFNYVFRLLHPFFLFRAGVRQTNDTVTLAGRELCSAVFYGFNNPKYRLINSNDTLFLLTIPDNVKPVVFRQSYRRDGGHVGQGGDFIQEEENRNITNLLPEGVIPTAEQWSEASCSVQKIREV